MNPKKHRNSCLVCGKECKRPKSKYCSTKCQCDYQHKSFIQHWLDGDVNGNTNAKIVQISKHIKKYMLEEYGHACYKCGWNKINRFTGKCPLEVHHIDGDPYNTVLKNLILLCPNCHSLTENYKSRGNGRKNRKQGDML